MPDTQTPYKLDFDTETRKQLEMALCNRVSSAVSGAAERNSSLQQWRDQLDGLGVTASNKNWPNACNVCDPITKEAFLTILSQIVGASHRDPKVAVEAFSKDDEEGARILESWLSMESSRAEIDARLFEIAYNACWAPYSPAYAGWEQTVRVSREVGYRERGKSDVILEEERDDSLDYEEVPLAEEVVEERYLIRAVDPANFYLYPAAAVSIERATMVAERMSLTEEELYDGIRDFGFEREAVEDLCRMGSRGRTEDQEIIDSQDGLEGDVGKDGFYEVFTCYTRLPRMLGGEMETPDHLLQDDFLVACSPQAGIVLKIAFSPFKERPYFLSYIMPRPGRYQGDSLAAMLEGLQDEGNANLQFTVDMMNLTATPCLIGPASEKEKMAKQQVYAGAYIECDSADVRPLEWDRSPLRDGLAWQQDLRNRAKALVSAEGQGQLQGKVRKQGEIDNIQAQSSAKFGMYLSNFQRTGVAELFRRLISLKLQFGDPGEDGEEFSDAEGKSHKLTAEALRGKYSIVASGTSLTHSPEARDMVNQRKMAVQTEYLKAKIGGMPADVLALAWHGAREVLFDLGERNPEAWIGEEPKPEEQPQQQAPPPQMGGQGPTPPQMIAGGMGA